MMTALSPISPDAAADLVAKGKALLIDVREPDEFARRHVPGSLSRPLSQPGAAPIVCASDAVVIFACRSGMRTRTHAARLAAMVAGPAHWLEGGVDAWARTGLPISLAAGGPIEIMRQVQIAAGSLVIAGVLLGWLLGPVWTALAGFVGAGLVFAGASGTCGMAMLLARMPWNRAVMA
ncbi:rhodanese family protein [Sandarakinorhabdus sp.]|uniref:rhodanese family protein n=1 Tax=Sandarakinorhabdus sp. TaxID=1916663 RepID=UPI00286D95C7|nr:rhodanese family protein [Sandarakinorhabdus sp.]